MTKDDLLALVRPNVRALIPYHLERHDVAIKLDQNENAFGAPEGIREDLLRRLERVPLHRYPDPGQPQLRRELGKLANWPAEGVLVGNGSDDLLHVFADAVLEPGLGVVVPAPSFFVYGYTARVAGAKVFEVPLGEDLNYDLEELVATVEKAAPRVVYLCSPNNPTGTALEPAQIETILSKAPGLVVLDEAYWEFNGWNGRELLEGYRNLVLFRTFSKAAGLAGLRIGYLLAAPELAAEIVKVQQPYPLNRLSQEAAFAALAHYDAILDCARAIVSERDRLFEKLSSIEGVRVTPSRTNFLLFRTPLGAEGTYRALLQRGVLVRNVSGHPLLRGCLRLNVGTPEENESVVESLRDALSQSGDSLS